MSSSNVFSHFSWAAEAHPVGSEEFIQHFYRDKEENSSEGLKLKQLQEQHQVEVQKAYQNGYAQGEAAGLQKGLAEARHVESQLAAAINALLAYQQSVYEQARTQLLEMSFALADKITSARAVAEQDTVVGTINRCVAEILDKTRIKIKVSPEQYDFVKSKLGELIRNNESISAAVVECDSRVSLGGCIIETDSGSADARIECQLNMLRDKLIALEQTS